MAGPDNYLTDGDDSFIGVDTHIPPQKLGAGIAADAVNKRFEDGRAWPRYGITTEPWGTVPSKGANLVAGGATYAASTYYQRVNVGQWYRLTKGAHETDALVNGASVLTAANKLPDGTYLFIATAIVLALKGSGATVSVTATLRYGFLPRAYHRFIDPDGFDNTVIATDEPRNGGGEDGGQGRIYRAISGTAIQEIPLNGHDIYGEARLVPCFNGLMLLRRDTERHYVSGAAFNTSTKRIQFNAAPNWASGDLVFFFAFPDSYVLGTSPPAAGTLYYVKTIAGNKAELYADAALTTQLDFAGGAVGRFYIERRSTRPGFYGTGAPPLLLQTDGSGATVWQIGFKAVPVNIQATAWDGTGLVLSAPNHRLIPGDQIVYTHTTLATQTFYVNPVSPDAVSLFTTVDKALAGLFADAQTPSPAWTAGDYITKAGASGLATPPMREGAYLSINRFMGVNQRNILALSDPMDPVHFTPFEDTVTASLGEGDTVNGLLEMSKDRVLVGKDNSLLQFLNVSQASGNWALQNLTKEYGWIAPLAMISVGKDGWGLSRKGVTSVAQTVQGELQGLAEPISRPMRKYIEQIDWVYARQACAASWNNRVFWAVPLKGQPANNVINNGVLVWNILNQQWEGLWNGDLLKVYSFARCVVYGQERLCFLNYRGQVCFFNEGFTDNGQPISDSLLTRTYSGQGVMANKPKLWLISEVIWDTFAPSLSVSAVGPGYNEAQDLVTNLVYDKTKYQVYGKADYNPAAPANFNDPYRADYAPSISELTSGPLDAHQNTTEKFRMRMNDWGVQISIENSNGSTRIQAVTVKAQATLDVGSRRV